MKQKTMLGIALLMASFLVVVVVINVVPFVLVPTNGGNGDVPPEPPNPLLDPPDSPVLKTIIPVVSYDGEIRLEWDDVSGADDYAVYRKKNDGSFELVDVTVVSYYDDLVLDNGVYCYKLKSGNINSKYSDFSNEKSVTVQIPSVPEQPHMNQLTYEIIEDTIRVCIDWDEVGCESYNLYKSIDGSDYNLIEVGLISTSYYEVLTEVGMYMYKVSAVNIYGESELSVSVTVEVTEDGVPPDELDEPDDYTMLYILLGVLAILIVPIIVIKTKKRKK